MKNIFPQNLQVLKNYRLRETFATAILFLVYTIQTSAADWPMLRHDASRTAASPYGITENPKLLWSRKLPPTQPAWSEAKDFRSKFDHSYEPVVMDKSLIVASPNTGAITAYDTGTGLEKWRFFTNGPIRCAPACWKGKVYAGSDDGYLYCLNVATGELVWKFRGSPKDRPERRILGNEHLISFWPIRGGPVVKDGVVCFGAGIWPIFGTFIYALDAETGEVKWFRNDLNYLTNVRGDHDKLIEAGLSPEGSFLIIDDKLLVPCGRSMPAGLDFKTGKLIFYTMGYYGEGDCHLAASENYIFVGQRAILNTYDFRELGTKWAYRGDKAPDGYPKGAVHVTKIPVDLFECPMLPYNQTEICNAWSAFDAGMAYSCYMGEIRAYNLKESELFEREINWRGKIIHPLTWKAKLIWKLKIPSAEQNSKPLTKARKKHYAAKRKKLLWEMKIGQPGINIKPVIKAGKRIYAYAKQKMVALENIEGTPKIAWEKDIVGTLSSMLAADNKLFVVTEEGWIHCFGDGTMTKIYDGKPVVLKSMDDEASEKVAKLINSSKMKTGYCVVQGIADGCMLEELLGQSEMIIIAIDDNPAKINSLKKRFDDAGLLGNRIELFAGKPFEFNLPPYMAKLMISEKTLSSETFENINISKTFDSLRPYGGVLCLKMDKEAQDDFSKKVKAARLAKAELNTDGAWTFLTRSGSLPGSGKWTHSSCDAANSLCSQDDLLKAPLGFLWFGDKSGCPQDVHVGKKVTAKVNGGRVFVLQQRRPRALYSYDAYTGLPLWQVDFKSFFTCYVAMDDGIYLASDGKCLIYDPESGKEIKSFDFGDAEARRVKVLKVIENKILIFCDSVDEKLERKISGKGNDRSWHKGIYGSTTLICLDRENGKELWRVSAKNRFANDCLAAGGEMVFCAEHNPISDEDLKANPKYKGTSTAYGISLRDGREIWTTDISRTTQLLLSQEKAILVAARRKLVQALDMKNGKILWEEKCGYDEPIMLNGKELILQKGRILDVSTGKRLRSIWREQRAGCNYAIACKNLLFGRRSSAGYVDLNNGKNYALRNIRSGCQNNLIPGDGLVNAPNYLMTCTCGYPTRTSFAMIHMPEVASWSGEKPVKVTPPGARPEMEAKIMRFKNNDGEINKP